MRRLALAVLLVLSACGGSSKGSVRLTLTDAPVDIANVRSVNVTLSRVEVHLAGTEKTDFDSADDHSIDDDGRWQSVTGGGKTLDLMALRNDVTATLGELDLPEGKITQIRIFLDTSKPENNTITFNDGSSCNLDTQDVDEKGIKINHPFKAVGVERKTRVTLKLDFDAAQSLEDDRNGGSTCAIRLKPVIKIKGEPVREDHESGDDDGSHADGGDDRGGEAADGGK